MEIDEISSKEHDIKVSIRKLVRQRAITKEDYKLLFKVCQSSNDGQKEVDDVKSRLDKNSPTYRATVETLDSLLEIQRASVDNLHRRTPRRWQKTSVITARMSLLP